MKCPQCNQAVNSTFRWCSWCKAYVNKTYPECYKKEQKKEWVWIGNSRIKVL